MLTYADAPTSARGAGDKHRGGGAGVAGLRSQKSNVAGLVSQKLTEKQGDFTSKNQKNVKRKRAHGADNAGVFADVC